ncbi:MAG: efflux RND transporter periplasmic adaptor subunit [Planctomycetia bacterium]|nr:efflux RND transporter periplasmic adaptor subunit [Planctomycetia bacterium]
MNEQAASDTPNTPPNGAPSGRPGPGGGRPTTLRERVHSLKLPPPEPKAPGRSWLPWALCGVFAASTLVLGWLALGRSTSATPTPSAVPTTSPSSVRADASPGAAGEAVLESKGYIVPVHQIQVSPIISAVILELNIEEGKRVKKGDVLARLEAVEYQSERDRIKAQVEMARWRLKELENGNRPQEIRQAEAELKEAKAVRERLLLDVQRSASLDRNTLSQREREQILSDFEAADRRVARWTEAFSLMKEGPRSERIEQARAEVKLYEAELARAQWRLDNCVVRAPITGTILTKKAEEGNIVNPVAFNVAASLCEMADLSEIEVDLNIQERDVANVHKGQRCKVRSEAFPDRQYEGVVSRLMPIADRAKGAVPVRVKVKVPRDEEGIYLKPEMSVLVSFLK